MLEPREDLLRHQPRARVVEVQPVAQDVQPAPPRDDVVRLTEQHAADGQLGGQTRDALRNFQASIGAPADGFASSDVLERLRGR